MFADPRSDRRRRHHRRPRPPDQVPGKQHISMVMTVVLGIVGAIIGGLIGGLINDSTNIFELNVLGFILAVVAAVLLVGATPAWRAGPTAQSADPAPGGRRGPQSSTASPGANRLNGVGVPGPRSPSKPADDAEPGVVQQSVVDRVRLVGVHGPHVVDELAVLRPGRVQRQQQRRHRLVRHGQRVAGVEHLPADQEADVGDPRDLRVDLRRAARRARGRRTRPPSTASPCTHDVHPAAQALQRAATERLVHTSSAGSASSAARSRSGSKWSACSWVTSTAAAPRRRPDR